MLFIEYGVADKLLTTAIFDSSILTVEVELNQASFLANSANDLKTGTLSPQVVSGLLRHD